MYVPVVERRQLSKEVVPDIVVIIIFPQCSQLIARQADALVSISHEA